MNYSTLQTSLSSFAGIRLFDVVNKLPVHVFRCAYRRVNDGDFEVGSIADDGRIALKVVFGKVVAVPKTISREPKTPSDCFDFACSCGGGGCEHIVAAWIIIHYAATGRFKDFRALGRLKIEELSKTFSFLSAEPPSREIVDENGDQVFLRALLFCVNWNVPWNIDSICLKVEDIRPAINLRFSDITSRSRWIYPGDYTRAPFNTPPQWGGQYSNGRIDNLCGCHFEIQYLFSDGTILDAHQILYHAYGGIVERNLLAISDDIPQELRDFTGRAATHSGNGEMAMLRILQNAIARKEEGLGILFVSGKDATAARCGFGIEDVQFITPDEAMKLDSPANLGIMFECAEKRWPSGELDRGAVCIKPVWGPGFTDCKVIPFETFLLDPLKRVVIFHPHTRAFTALMKMARRRFGDYKHGSGEGPFLLQELERRPFRGHEDIGLFVRDLRESPGLKSVPIFFSPKVLHVGGDKTKPCLSINSDGAVQYAVGLDFKETPITALNPGPTSRRVLEGFHSGFRAFFYRSKFNYVADWRSPKRKNDLKLMSHAGIYAMTVMEVAGTMLEIGGRRERSEIIEGIFSKIAVLLTGSNKGGSDTGHDCIMTRDDAPWDIRKICSCNAVNIVRKVIELFFDLISGEKEGDDVTLFTGMGPISFHCYDRAFFLFLGELVRGQALRTKGACLAKSRTPPFFPFWDEGGAKGALKIQAISNDIASAIKRAGAIRFHGVEKDDLVAAAIRLRSHGCNAFYEGRPVEQLNSDDFRAEFVLNEDVENADGTGGSKISWFDLHPKFFFNGVEIDEESVRRMGKTGLLEWRGRLYMIDDKKLPSIAYLERFWNRLSAQSEKDRNATSEGGGFLRLPRNQTLELLLLKKQGVPIRGGRDWENICEFYDSLDAERKLGTLPPTMRAKLKHYQETGVRWLLDLKKLGLGGVLADDMGLGKTIQALAFLDILRARGEMGGVLIVVPTSLTYNWLAEKTRFTPEVPAIIFESRDKAGVEKFIGDNPHAAVISTYGLLVEHEEFFKKFNWNIVIYDEAQHLKNIAAKRTTVSRGLAAGFKIGLTGTPLENHFGECYSLLDLVVPGCLGEYETFRSTFVSPESVGREAMADLRLKIKPLILRRHKSEILKELPAKTESEVVLPFEERQKKIYRNIAISWNEKVRESVEHLGEAKSQIMMLTALLRLRQACSDPASLPRINYPKDPPKIELLSDSIKEITESGESALVFTQFLATFERIKKRLNADGIRHFSIYGAMSHMQRKKEIASFESCNEGAVFLMTLKTGGVGLNLTKASYVFHIEPWWNPAVENQATDRTHRIGQTKHVQVYRYLMEESVEQKIEILKRRKSEKFAALFGHVEGEADLKKSPAGLTKKDFDYLLG